MDLVLPSITAMVIALFVIVYVFPKLAPVMLALFAGAALVYGFYNHYTMFGPEYDSMTWLTKARSLAPYIMVGTVISFLIGYLLFMAGAGKSISMPRPYLPPANTATNAATNMINRGMVSANRNMNANARNEFSRRV